MKFAISFAIRLNKNVGMILVISRMESIENDLHNFLHEFITLKPTKQNDYSAIGMKASGKLKI